MRRRLLIAALPTAVAAALLSVPAAQAGTQIGLSTAADKSCSAPATLVQTGTVSASYTVPQGGGVITSWGFNAGANPGTRKLKLFRPTDSAAAYVVVGESAAEAGAPSRRNDFATRIRVAGGEVLGFYTTSGNNCGSGGSDGFIYSRSGDTPVGTVYQPTNLEFSTFRLDITATVEPDADGDGYGDESQDRCPTDRAVFLTPCHADLSVSASAGPERLRLGEKITYRFRAANAGPLPARDAEVALRLPPRAPVVSKSPGCSGRTTIRCDAGNLASGLESRTYTVVVRAPDAGDLTAVATARSATVDPVEWNDIAGATVAVLPPRFGGARASRRSTRVVKGKVPVVVSCPIAARSCAGTLALTASRRITLGTSEFKLKGGKRRTVRVALDRAARRRLRGRRRVRVVATVRSTDAFDQSRTLRAKLAIVARRRR